MPVNMEIEPNIYWDGATTEHSVLDMSFNFPVNALGEGISEDEYHQQTMKRKISASRDPMSHRIIEKRRRDRMNNCLADLSRLIPTEYMKKGRGRIEKTEIIEMAIKHMKYLQISKDRCEVNEQSCDFINDKQFVNGAKVTSDHELSPQEHYKLGYQECMAETMRFLVELQGFSPGEALCVKLISHLQKYYEKLTKGDKIVSSAVIEDTRLSTYEEVEKDGYSATSINEKNYQSDVCSQENISTNGSFSSGSNSSSNYNGNSSQLREMLVNPHLNAVYIPAAARPDLIRLITPEPLLQTDSNINDNHVSNGSLYKFKNYIRERFEHSTGDKSSTSMIMCSTKRRLLSSSNLSSSQHSSQSEDCKNGSRPIPIFALHSKGSFYVPLTVDSRLLAPFINDLNNDHNVHGFSSLLLHPVTISVNFNRASQSSTLLPTSVSFSSKIPGGSLLMVPECR